MIDYRTGDSRTVTATLPDGSVDLIASSPPFLALRSYLPAGHESKHLEIGSEANPAAFLDTLLGLTAEWGRVLAPHGSIAIELGDTYSGSGGGGGDYLPGGLREHQPGFGGSAEHQRAGNAAHWRAKNATPDAWPLAKSLALIPQLYAVALAYGINPLTGQPSPAGRWRVRNVIVWHRPNPAVGGLGDKVRPSTSYIVVATRNAKRWFDLTAVRGGSARDYSKEQPVTNVIDGHHAMRMNPGQFTHYTTHNPAGAPPLDAWFDEYDGSHDTWTLTTQPSSLAHYAMWPAKLAERLILMMCPAHVCRVCGEPRRRVERTIERDRSAFDVQPRLAAHIKERREACGYTSTDVNGWFGYKEIAKNWERTDKHGAAIPNANDWPVLKERLGLSDEFDAVVMGERVWTVTEINDPTEYLGPNGRTHEAIPRDKTKNIVNGHGGHTGKVGPGSVRQGKTLGWTDCGCVDPNCPCGSPDGHTGDCPSQFRPGLVLDPFAGTGTTLCVAELHGRDSVGIDIDPRNRDLMPRRMDEVKRALFGTPAPMAGQMELAL